MDVYRPLTDTGFCIQLIDFKNKGRLMSDLIVKDNALIEASYTLGLVEQRLILLGLLQLNGSMDQITSNTLISVHASDYIKQFGVEKHTAYKAMQEASECLFNRYFRYGENGKSRWVQDVNYIEHNGAIEFHFAREVIPLVTELKARFTYYEVQQIADLTSAYAIRLYELLIKWRGQRNTPKISLERLRAMLGVKPNQYKAMGDFKGRVLDLALTQINEHTDITASYKQHKQGRRITGFTFEFEFKKKTAKLKEETNAETVQLVLSAKQCSYFSSKLANDPALSNLAATGETMTQFTQRIEKELAKPESLQKFLPHLIKHGFKPPEKLQKTFFGDFDTMTTGRRKSGSQGEG